MSISERKLATFNSTIISRTLLVTFKDSPLTNTVNHFTRQIKTEWGYFTFYFNKVYSVDGVRYHVSFNDKDRKVVVFQMYLIDSLWSITNPVNCPEWLINLQQFLSEIINSKINGKN